jgi:hypothetical protein
VPVEQATSSSMAISNKSVTRKERGLDCFNMKRTHFLAVFDE